MAIKIIHEVRIKFVPGDGDEDDRELLHNIFSLVKSIHNKTSSIIMTQEELVQGLKEATGHLIKIKGESTTTLEKVANLEAALNNQGQVAPEVADAFNELKAQIRVVDDLIPDTPSPTPVEGEGL